MHGESFTEPVHQFTCVIKHDIEDFAELRRISRFAPIENITQITEKPGAAETAAADDHAITTRFPDHSKRVFGFPNIAISENWNFEGLLELRDRLPVRVSMIKLSCSPRVEADRCTALILGNPSRCHKREVIVVDSHPK